MSNLICASKEIIDDVPCIYIKYKGINYFTCNYDSTEQIKIKVLAKYNDKIIVMHNNNIFVMTKLNLAIKLIINLTDSDKKIERILDMASDQHEIEIPSGYHALYFVLADRESSYLLRRLFKYYIERRLYFVVNNENIQRIFNYVVMYCETLVDDYILTQKYESLSVLSTWLYDLTETQKIELRRYVLKKIKDIHLTKHNNSEVIIENLAEFCIDVRSY